ncbi:MAG: amidophosphoribosyltransferase [Phycisphaerae bacterium]|nr:amidophosphoribosyltransferase [Phycisphaerae bacterium]
MSDELHHECGIAALYCLDKSVGRGGLASQTAADGDVTKMMPMMLLNLQNRGQLAAGLSSYDPNRMQLLDTFKDIGNVGEAFRMSHPSKHAAILQEYAGKAVIGHVRYATCGKDDARYAQPFERHHGRLWKWYSFGFNGNLANYTDLRDRLLAKRDYHFTLDTDTEIIMHELAYRLRGDRKPDLVKVMSSMSKHFDGAYNMVFLDALGRMVVARDPLGLRPLSYGVQGKLFGAASESVALTNLGFDQVCCLPPGQMAIIEDGSLRFEEFAKPKRKAHCFFEWVYFSNVASEMDGTGVYVARANLGKRLAELEDQAVNENSIVVPVPDTAKAAADSYAYHIGIPCVEGLMRNRYVGRTFIQSDTTRSQSVRYKYTPLPSVLTGKKVFLVEDSIVRSTTLRSLVKQIRRQGGASEVHVRVACPPIIAPCFYGIDMSTIGELFAPSFFGNGYNGCPSDKTLARMAKTLGLDSLRYLSVPDLSKCLEIDGCDLCTGCVTGKYPSKYGNKLIAAARKNTGKKRKGRTYE